MIIMSQTLQKRPAEQKPFGRRLTLQHLEERLTLSSSTGLEILPTTLDINFSSTGGFVNVGVFSDRSSLAGNGDVLNFTTSGTPSFFSFDPQGIVLPNNDEVLIGDGHLNLGVDLNAINAWIDGPNKQVIPPPELLPSVPGGGTVPISVDPLPITPLVEEPRFVKETRFVEEVRSHETDTPPKESNLFLATAYQGSTPKITLSRGREISFRVATVAPPQSIVRPSHVVLEASDPSHKAVQTENASREDPDAVSRGANISSPEKATIEAINTQPSESKQARAISIPPASYPISQMPNRRDLDINTTEPAALRLSAIDASHEEEARSQVFADWRSREMITLPVLLALAAAPRLVRSLRAPTTEAQQMPPK